MMMLNQTMAHAMERLRGVFGLISFPLGFNISGRDEHSGSSRPDSRTQILKLPVQRHGQNQTAHRPVKTDSITRLVCIEPEPTIATADRESLLPT